MCFNQKRIGKMVLSLVCITLMTVAILQIVKILEDVLFPISRDKFIMVNELKENVGTSSKVETTKVKKISNNSHQFATVNQLQVGGSFILSLVIYVNIYIIYKDKQEKQNQKAVKM